MSSYHRLDPTLLSTLRIRVLALLFGLLMASVGLSAAVAESPGQEEIATFRQIIDSQIAAFNRDDAEGAYQFASPGIKTIFPTAEIFMAMVRRGYPPVYRAKVYSFDEVAMMDGRILQPVRITLPEGGTVVALYTMERQSDGSWRIAGCTLVRDSGKSV